MDSILFDRQQGLAGKPVAALIAGLVAGSVASGDRLRVDSMRNVLYNLWVASSYEASTGRPTYVAISRDRNAYRHRRRYGQLHFTYKPIISALDTLKHQGLMAQHKGYRDRERGIGRVTRIRAAPQLERWFSTTREEMEMVSLPSPCVIVRDASKQLVPPPNAEKHRRMSRRVEQINDHLLKHRVTLSRAATRGVVRTASERTQSPDRDAENKAVARHGMLSTALLAEGDPCDLTRSCRLRRIFNRNRLDQGGRFYAPVQSLPEAVRTRLRIDDEPVVELDYSAHHPRLLYALEGTDFRGDPYTIDGMSRNDAKKVALICVNAENRTQAKRAINDARRRGKIRSCSPASTLLNDFGAAHEPLERQFYSGAGLNLMYRDSQVTEAILLRFAKSGEACVPVHDSYIVRASQEDMLRTAMIEEYEKHTGFAPVIK